MHAMQYNVYLLYTKTTESLYLLSMADWAADYDYKRLSLGM